MAVTRRSRSAYLQLLASVALTVGVLLWAKAVFVPIALAGLLAFTLNPVVVGLQRRGLPRVAAVIVTVSLGLVACGGLAWVVGSQAQQLARELPKHRKQIETKVESVRGAGGSFSEVMTMIRELSGEKSVVAAPGEPTDPSAQRTTVVQAGESSGVSKLFESVAPVIEPLATAGFVVILVVYLLVRREDLRNRFIGVFGHGQVTGTTRLMVDAAERLSKYLLNQLLVNVAFGVIFAVGLWVIGVPYAALWGALTMVLRFVPYIGSWIAVAFPLALSTASTDGWAQPLQVLGFFAVLDLIVANAIEPLLFGHSTGVSPVALLVAAVFWTWLWGPVGLVLSTPLTVCLVVLGSHVKRLRFLALLLGDEPALEPHVSVYQRLLSKDRAEAEQVAAAYGTEHGTDRVYDDVLVPVLRTARRDRRAGVLTAADEDEVLAALNKLVPAFAPEPEPVDPDHPLPAHGSVVLACPAHHPAEELTLRMLARGLQCDGNRVDVVHADVPPEMVDDIVRRRKPAMVLVGVLPPGGLAEARYLCRRLRRQFPNLLIVVGCWCEERHAERVTAALRAAGASRVATTLAAARQQVCNLAGASHAQAEREEVAAEAATKA